MIDILRVKEYNEINLIFILQGEVQILTGGKAREPKG